MSELDEFYHMIRMIQANHTMPDSKHYAVILPHKNISLRSRVVMGTNRPTTSNGLVSYHAEHIALMKLAKKRNKPRRVDLLVIRLSKTGILGESRPCRHCIERIMNQTDVRICMVYYSTRNGGIRKEKPDVMRDNPITYISIGYRARAAGCNNIQEYLRKYGKGCSA